MFLYTFYSVDAFAITYFHDTTTTITEFISYKAMKFIVLAYIVLEVSHYYLVRKLTNYEVHCNSWNYY